jgi:MFS transporter, OPA family, sugar phosphate sensor protein UhpC
MQVVMLYCIGIVACLTGLRFSPAGVFWVQWLLVFLLGFCIYGPQMLIGLCGAELVGPESVGASEGFLGWIAYLGAANAGVPLSLIVKNMGWDAYFNALTGAAVIAFCIMAPMFRLQSHVQREKEKLLETADEGDEPSSPAPAKKLA